MEKPILITEPGQVEQGTGLANEPELTPLDLVRDDPDAHWVLVDDDGKTSGQCSVWWRNTPIYARHNLGLIGHYSVRDGEAARLILQHACGELAAQGCTLAVGPMDGGTSKRYRLITERGSEPVFFLEPDNPDDWPGHFLDNGFTPLATYTSALNEDLTNEDPRMREVADRIGSLGIRIQHLNPQHVEDQLHRIYTVSRMSFQHNFLNTPITEEEFVEQYRKFLRFVQPELTLIAVHNDHPVGFLFALPDWLEAQRGQEVKTVVLKTVAVVPWRQTAGLGGLLVGRGQRIARELGYTRVIHALMHETNKSRGISRRYARTIRRYALFGKALEGQL